MVGKAKGMVKGTQDKAAAFIYRSYLPLGEEKGEKRENLTDRRGMYLRHQHHLHQQNFHDNNITRCYLLSSGLNHIQRLRSEQIVIESILQSCRKRFRSFASRSKACSKQVADFQQTYHQHPFLSSTT